MKRRSFLGTVGAAPALLAQAPTPPPKTHLKVGDAAPDFTLPSTTGKPVTLSELRAKGTVVVGFLPAAFTGGCTKEVKGYQENLSKFQDSGAQVLLISTDNLPTLQPLGWRDGRHLSSGQRLHANHRERVRSAHRGARGSLTAQLSWWTKKEKSSISRKGVRQSIPPRR